MFNMLFYDLIKSIGSDDNLKNKVVDLKPLFKVMFEQGFISGSKDGVEKYIESKEFKIDWSQAPEWAEYWESILFNDDPRASPCFLSQWVKHEGIYRKVAIAPSFNCPSTLFTRIDRPLN